MKVEEKKEVAATKDASKDSKEVKEVKEVKDADTLTFEGKLKFLN